MKRGGCALILTLLGFSYALCFASLTEAPAHHQHTVKVQPVISGPPGLENASVTTAIFDHKGRLWLAWVQGEYIYVNYSDDLGSSFSTPRQVNPEPEKIHNNGEARPKIAVDAKGFIYVAYTQRLPKRFTGNIRFSRSVDSGQHFSKPVTINDNHEIISHRFVTLALNQRGHIYLTWLDGRDNSAAKADNRDYYGSAIYYTYSRDQGASFSNNIKIADHTCQCCRIAMTMDDNDDPVIMWRHIFDGKYRDHALVHITDKQKILPVSRVSYDNWQARSCPHHGPTLAIAADGSYHMAWFNLRDERPGLFYASSQNQGQSYSSPQAFGDPEHQIQHPYILSQGRRLYLAWKAFDGKHTSIYLQQSDDMGNSWGTPRALATTSGSSDHPFLLKLKSRVFISWHTAEEAYRLIEVKPLHATVNR